MGIDFWKIFCYNTDTVKERGIKMRVEVKKVVTLSECDRDVLRNAIRILEYLNQEVEAEYEYANLISDIEEILYHEPWEVEYEV